MTNTLTTNGTAAAIIEHHDQAKGAWRKCHEHVLEAGRLLFEQKAKLSHGEWLPWVRANLPFGRRTASNYIAAFKAFELKWETASHLLGPDSSSGTYDSAQASSDIERIREHLNGASSAFLEILPDIKQLLEVRDAGEYAPKYATFDAYLLSERLDPLWFHSREKLFEAIVEWSQDGPADNLLELLRMQVSEREVVS